MASVRKDSGTVGNKVDTINSELTELKKRMIKLDQKNDREPSLMTTGTMQSVYK